jgi:hypothetical protein
MERGCGISVQWVVSASVRRSAALQIEKNGSTCTSGTAGGRIPANAGTAAARTVANIILFIFLLFILA